MGGFGLLLVSAAGTCLLLGGAGFLLLRGGGGPPALAAPVAPGQPDAEDAGGADRFVRGLSARLGMELLPLLPDRMLAQVRRRLDVAGHPDGMTVVDFVGQRALVALLTSMGAVGVWVQFGDWRGALALAGAGAFLVDARIAAVGRQRQAQIDRARPDILDLTASSIAAGTGFRATLARVAESTGGPLGEELTTALRQIEVGASRREAFADLRERNASKVLGQFVGAVLQAEDLGTPLSDVLLRRAADLRKKAGEMARQRASRAELTVTAVVVLVVMPATLLLIISSFALTSDWSGIGLLGGVLP